MTAGFRRPGRPVVEAFLVGRGYIDRCNGIDSYVPGIDVFSCRDGKNPILILSYSNAAVAAVRDDDTIMINPAIAQPIHGIRREIVRSLGIADDGPANDAWVSPPLLLRAWRAWRSKL